LIPSLRQRFNEQFRPEKYQRFLRLLEQRSHTPAHFRHSETPFFLPNALASRMAEAGQELIFQLTENRSYLADSEKVIPDQWRVRGEEGPPLFVQVDFGLDTDLNPQLVEIQGFPTLYAYQPVMAECYQEAYDLGDLAYLPNGLTLDEYKAKLRQAIVGDHYPDEVVLLEIDPWNQKTCGDFRVTEEWFGVRTVDILDVKQIGRSLFYERDGRRVPIRRIYNRAIVDELERRGVTLPFDITGDLDVEWAGHPNWFFRISKFSLPYLHHATVPETHFLSSAPRIQNPADWVLKPLFSFAGLGVVVGPTQEQIEAADPESYILQRRIQFASPINTPHGPTKCEIRMMYLWLDDEPELVNLIIRTGRGAQMGVDFNKGLEWVGASAAFLA
jgi:hypothetical protein